MSRAAATAALVLLAACDANGAFELLRDPPAATGSGPRVAGALPGQGGSGGAAGGAGAHQGGAGPTGAGGAGGADGGASSAGGGPAQPCAPDPAGDATCEAAFPLEQHALACPGGVPPATLACVPSPGGAPGAFCCDGACVPTDPSEACVGSACSPASDGCGGWVACVSDCPVVLGPAVCSVVDGGNVCTTCLAYPQGDATCIALGLPSTPHAYTCNGAPQSFCVVTSVVQGTTFGCCP